MKKNIIKISFVVLVFMSLIVNFSQSNNTNTANSSLVMLNGLAIANAEGSGTYVCIQPPRVICHFLNDWTPIYGIHY